MNIRELLEKSISFKKDMLCRLKSDCDYFLGMGNRNVNNLWSKDVYEHIRCLKALWHSLPRNEKPFTFTEIIEIECKMKGITIKRAD